MNVVLEGPDGSGKSTLASELMSYTGVHVQQGSGPPRRRGEIEERARSYLAMNRVIFDRHPCVSQIVYGQIRNESPSPEFMQLVAELYTQPNLFIYCRTDNLDRHVVKADENPAHIKALVEKFNLVLAAYDSWALSHAHYVYRIGDDINRIIQLVQLSFARG